MVINYNSKVKKKYQYIQNILHTCEKKFLSAAKNGLPILTEIRFCKEPPDKPVLRN